MSEYIEKHRQDVSTGTSIKSIKEDFCDNYCKYPDTWNERKKGVELCESEICRNCPLNRL